MNLEQLTDALLEKLAQQKPRAYLIGTMPKVNDNFYYVNKKPYDAVVIGLLQPGQLLRMPSNTVCCALLQGKPVYFCAQQSWRSAGHAKALCRELSAAEQRLYKLGALPLEQSGKLLTAQEARTMRQLGQKPEATRRMTPLARDILEGREP